METMSPAAGELPFTTQKVLVDARVTMAEILQRNGYSTAGFVSNMYVNSIFGFAQGFELYDDAHGDYSNDVAGAKRRGHETNARVFRWLEDPPAEPFFLLVHYNDAHWPYNPPAPHGADFVADYRGRVTPETTGLLLERSGRPVRDLSPDDWRYITGLYDGEVQFTDAVVGRLLEKLSRLSLERPLVTVITGDHGEELLDHGASSHGYTLFEESIRVPLILHAPGLLEPQRVSDQVRSIDLLPTLLDLAGIRRPQLIQGRSLLALIRGEEAGPEYAFSEATYGQGVVGRLQSVRTRDGRKLIVREAAPANPGLLFDLRRDPAERTNRLAHDEPRRLLAALETWRRANREVSRTLLQADPGSEEIVLDEETLRRLRALGYVD